MASFVRPDKLPRQQPRLSKWEKADIRTERRSRISKHELLREDVADRLRCPLCFCLPCVIIVFILLILIGIYVIQPYIQGRGLISTQCRVNRTETTAEGSCSYRTDKVQPCLKIMVTHNASRTSKIEAVLMENEQALVHCEKCSYTFGSSDLFGRFSTCAWNSDLSVEDCVRIYMNLYGTPNRTFSCFYDPEKVENVARIIKYSSGEAVAMVLIPLLFLLLWLLAVLFLICDSHLRSTIDEQIIQENSKANKYPKGVTMSNGSSLPRGTQNSGFELETTVVSTASTVVSGVATHSTRRRRKKKMPCSRQHYQFNYLDEGILLEDKPLSSAPEQVNTYSYVTVDTSPVCTCHHNGYVEAGFDLLPYSRDYFTPVSSTPSRNSRYSNQQGLIVLPESFV